MKTNTLLKSQSWPRLQPAHIDLAAHLGACMARERVGLSRRNEVKADSKRLAMLNRIYINMTAGAKERVRAAMRGVSCNL